MNDPNPGMGAIIDTSPTKSSAPRRQENTHGYPRRMKELWMTIGLLSLSNVFMTFAWYAHLKELNNKPWIVAALFSWGIALFEYLLQVPGNRIGHTVMSVARLKLDYLWAGLCILGAVFFIFRSRWFGG